MCLVVRLVRIHPHPSPERESQTSVPRTLTEPLKKADARQALLELTRVVGGGSLPAEKLQEALALIPDFQCMYVCAT